MKYLIQISATVERGTAIEKAGGPGPLFSYLVERLHPEAAWGTPTARKVFFVADIDDPGLMSEVMLVTSINTGCEPTFTPVYPLEEFGKIVARSMPNVEKAPRIG